MAIDLLVFWAGALLVGGLVYRARKTRRWLREIDEPAESESFYAELNNAPGVRKQEGRQRR